MTVKKFHVPPKYYGYKGGFADVGTCLKCGRTSLRADFHPVNPCKTCGSKNDERVWFAARWVNTAPWWAFWDQSGRWEVPADVSEDKS